MDSVSCALLKKRKSVALLYEAGETSDFLQDSKHPSKDPSWKCAAVPADIQDRRVKIMDPVDRKMVINGLNSGTSVYMADLEDSISPTWSNLIEGQLNLRDAINGTISYTKHTTGKVYKLQEKTCVLFARPRRWDLDEAHMTVNGEVVSGSLVDFALYLFTIHNNLARKYPKTHSAVGRKVGSTTF